MTRKRANMTLKQTKKYNSKNEQIENSHVLRFQNRTSDFKVKTLTSLEGHFEVKKKK